MGRTATQIIPANHEAIKRAIRLASGSRVDYRIKGEKGLVLRTLKSGVGVFYLVFSAKHGGGQRKKRLGEFGVISLAEAVEMAHEARRKIEQGKDPAKSDLTFKALAERFIAESALSAKSKAVYADCLARDAYPVIGSKAANAVAPDDVARICAKIRSRGSHVQPQRTKSMIGGVYRWGMKYAGITCNPAKEVPNQLELRSVSRRQPSQDDLRQLWNALDERERVTPQMRLLVKLCILTAQRRDEVAGARVTEVNFNTRRWTIQGDVIKAGKITEEGRMKSGAEQKVYLSRQALALFDEARKTCSDGEYFFPGSRDQVRHIRGDSVTHLIGDLTGGKFSIHDVRRAVATFAKNRGYGKEVRDLLLHHKDGSVDAIHYSAAATMEDQCRALWQEWADHCAPDNPPRVKPALRSLPYARVGRRLHAR